MKKYFGNSAMQEIKKKQSMKTRNGENENCRQWNEKEKDFQLREGKK